MRRQTSSSSSFGQHSNSDTSGRSMGGLSMSAADGGVLMHGGGTSARHATGERLVTLHKQGKSLVRVMHTTRDNVCHGLLALIWLAVWLPTP